MTLTLPLLLAACLGPAPDVTSVDPELAMPGDPLTVVGTAFDEEVAGLLTQGETRVPLPLHVLSETSASATVPEDLPSGAWTFHVETPRGRHGAARSLEVWRPETEVPCDKRYALDVETSRTQKKVVIERIFRDRPPTRDVFFEADLVAVEHTRTPSSKGPCSAVWLVAKDDRRWLLGDDPARDLAPVARELATSLGVELRDAPGPLPPDHRPAAP